MRPFFYRRGSAACQQQLLEDKVHLTAGTALVTALTHVIEATQAARSPRRGRLRVDLSQAAVLHAMVEYCALIMNATLLLLGLKHVSMPLELPPGRNSSAECTRRTRTRPCVLAFTLAVLQLTRSWVRTGHSPALCCAFPASPEKDLKLAHVYPSQRSMVLLW